MGGAIVRGFWGVSNDCQSWAAGNHCQLVQDDWWAKDHSCVARTSAGDELVDSESLGTKATGRVWQCA